MATETPKQTFTAHLQRLRETLVEAARDEEHGTLWSGPPHIDRVESLSVRQRERLLRQGLVRRQHGEP